MTTPTGPTTGRAPSSGAYCSGCGRARGEGPFCAGCGRQHETDQVIDVRDTVELPRSAPPAAVPTVPRQSSPLLPPRPTAPVATPAPEPEPSVEVRRSRWHNLTGRTRAAVAAAVVVALLALAASGVLVTRWLGDRDVRSALSTGQQQYRTVLASAEAAEEPTDVVGAARRATSAAAVLTDQADELRSRTDGYGRAARAQLGAEAAVLSALGGLSGLEEAPLDSWGQGHAALAAALDAETDTRAALARHDAGAVSGLPSADDLLRGLAAAVAPELAGDAATRARQLLGSLQSATRTAQLRDLAGPAGAQRAGVDAAAATLPDGPEKTALTGMATALGALSSLGEVSGASPDAWQESRGALAAGLTQVGAGSGDTALAADLTPALSAVDRLVQGAAAAIADWRARTAAATEARDADAAALKEYADGVRTTLARYGQLREDLATFTARVEDPNSFVSAFDGFEYMQSAAAARKGIRDSLNWMTVPADVRAAHAEVVEVVDRSTRAVESGYEGLQQWWYCTDCAYDETPGWTTFQTESDAITKTFATAMQTWDSAVAAAEAGITNRALPAEPDV